jgi:hypothetical protein
MVIDMLWFDAAVACRTLCCRWAPQMSRRAITSHAPCLSECLAAGSLQACRTYLLHV